MRELVIKRLITGPKGTFGVMLDPSDDYLPFVLTVERPWENNEPFVSCIPADIYSCKRVVTPKHGDCFEISGVPDRFAVLFHVANFPNEVQGCIGIGTQFAKIKGVHAVSGSRLGYGEFMDRLKDVDSFMLKITNAF